MKNYTKCVLAILSFIYSLVSTNIAFAARLPILAIPDLEAKYGVETDYSSALSVILRDEIHRHNKYDVLSQQDLAAVMSREQILQAMGCSDGGACLTDFGKAFGSEYMVAGTVSKIGSTWTVSLRLLDTRGEDAGLVNRASKSAQCNEEELIGLVKQVASELIGEETETIVAENPVEANNNVSSSHDNPSSSQEESQPGTSREHQQFLDGIAAYERQEYEAAANIWQILADKDHVEAMYRLADLYEWGTGVDRDLRRSVRYFRMSALRGHGDGQFAYANRLDSGAGVAKNHKLAYFWYNAVLTNPTASIQSRKHAGSAVRADENVSGFTLSIKEQELLKILEKIQTGGSPNLETSVFNDY